jgi:SHAQKYF class myb-like DNA-binding protein
MKNKSPQVLINNLYPNKISIQIEDNIKEKKKEIHSETIPKYNQGRWNMEEHKKFIMGILEYGNDWKNVQKLIKTRTSTQARSHAQKFFLRIKNDLNLNVNKNNSFNEKKNLGINDNFSIKFFFDLLNNFDKNKSCLKETKLNSEQKEKLIKILNNYSTIDELNSKELKDSNNNYNKIKINTSINLLEKNDVEEKNIKRKKIKIKKDKIFNIVKDNSNKENLNNKNSISTKSESGKLLIGKKKKENLSNSHQFLNYLEYPKLENNNPFTINFDLFEHNIKNDKEENNSIFDLTESNAQHDIHLSNFNRMYN